MKQNFSIGYGPLAFLAPVKSRARIWKFVGGFGAGVLMSFISATHVEAAEVIVSDGFNVESVGTGFALNTGVNAGIRPPTTRLVGSAAPGLRYLQTGPNRSAENYDIDRKRLRVKTGSRIARFTLSENGRTPFDFGPILRTDHASKNNKLVYDVRISMRNDATSSARFSFGIATMEGDINKMDFALQLYRAKSNDSFYTIQKRFDRGSYRGATTHDAEDDMNAVMNTTPPGTAGNMISFLIRVTDAGAEGAFTYNSRLQISLDDGSSWIYDTDSDSDLPNGFRMDGTSRYFVFDQAPNSSGNVFYDDFSVTLISQP